MFFECAIKSIYLLKNSILSPEKKEFLPRKNNSDEINNELLQRVQQTRIYFLKKFFWLSQNLFERLSPTKKKKLMNSDTFFHLKYLRTKKSICVSSGPIEILLFVFCANPQIKIILFFQNFLSPLHFPLGFTTCSLITCHWNTVLERCSGAPYILKK